MKSSIFPNFRKIDQLNEDFNFVLILELLDESLVLLKKLLCWDLKDIAYFKLNERLEESKSQMNINTRSMFYDIMIYNACTRNFWVE